MKEREIRNELQKELKAILRTLESAKEDDDEKAVMQFYGMAVECKDIMEMFNLYDSTMSQIYDETMDRVFE